MGIEIVAQTRDWAPFPACQRWSIISGAWMCPHLPCVVRERQEPYTCDSHLCTVRSGLARGGRWSALVPRGTCRRGLGCTRAVLETRAKEVGLTSRERVFRGGFFDTLGVLFRNRRHAPGRPREERFAK